MKPTSLLFVALVAISTLAPTSEAACANMAVYTDCKNRGNAQLTACGFDDWNCKCNANNAIQNCYLQCPDDPDIQTEGRAYQPAAQQACSLAASQSSAKAAATPVAATPATQPVPAQTPPPAVPSTSSSNPETSKTSENAKSSADGNKISVMIAAVPPVAAVIIGQFI